MNTLTFRYRPWLETLVGVLFMAGGTWAFAGGERVFGGGFVAAGAALLALFSNTVTNTFDRTSGQYTCVMKGLIRNRVVQHPLDEIKGVRVEASRSSHPSQSYRVALVLKSGARVPLTTSYSSGKADKERTASEIRRFLNLPEPPPETPLGFGEVVGMLFDSKDSSRDQRS